MAKTRNSSARETEGTLVDRVKTLIGQLIDESVIDGRLPSLSEMAERFGVGYTTVWRAAHELSIEGTLSLARGRKPRIGRSPPSEPSPTTERMSAAQRFASLLRERIEHGTFRLGQNLPKVGYFVLQEHVSNHTVLGALDRLGHEGLVTRRGKRWIVGGHPQGRSSSGLRDGRPVLVIMCHKVESWIALGTSERTAGFARTFMAEAERCGVLCVSCAEEAYPKMRGVVPVGWDAVRDRVLSCGDRYRGALLVGATAEGMDVVHWAGQLVSLGKPVVWFDRAEEMVTVPLPRKPFVRCRFSESAGVAAAVAALVDAGHAHAGYVSVIRFEPWRAARGSLLRAQAGVLGLEVIPCCEVAGFLRSRFSDTDCHDLDRFIGVRPEIASSFVRLRRSLDRAGVDTGRVEDAVGMALEYCERFLGPPGLHVGLPGARDMEHADAVTVSLTPVLWWMIERGGVTAIVAPNDLDARYLFTWLARAGFHPGLDVSLVSFDNAWPLQQFPVSSVDFGFGLLGYKAFHLLNGDIPVARSAGGDVPVEPFVAHRGSIGPPPRRPR